MTVSIAKMNIAYYLREAASGDAPGQRDLTSYYTGSGAPPGRWFGTGLTDLGLYQHDLVSERHARAVYERMQHPTTGQQLGRGLMKKQHAPQGAKNASGRAAKSTREGVAGYDLTFSPPKSISTLWALADPQLQGEIQAAHHEAVEASLEWVEENLLQTRAGHAGVVAVPVKGVIASLFDHPDSRAGDPQLHTHAVISNKAQRVTDGQWVSLDGRQLYSHLVAVSEMYTNLVLDRLHQRVGALPESREPTTSRALEAALQSQSPDDVETDHVPEPGGHLVELAGVPDSLISEFSQRARAIEVATSTLIAQWKQRHGDKEPTGDEVTELRRRAWALTRTPKDKEALPLSEKIHTWRSRALEAGHHPDAVVRAALGHSRRDITAEMLTVEVKETIAQWVIHDATRRRSSIGRTNLHASTERVLRLVRCSTPSQRQALTDQIITTALESKQLVELTPERPLQRMRYRSENPALVHNGTSPVASPKRYAARSVMDQEAFLITRATTTSAPALKASELAEALANFRTDKGYRLSGDQAQATGEVLTSGKALDAVIGPAGTGKTTTMSAISHHWQQEHGESSVIGLGPSAAAARVLAEETGLATENTAKWLYESTGPGAQRRYERVQQAEAHLADLTSHPGRPSRVVHARQERLRAQLAQEYADQARYTLRRGQLLIIDEASMVSTEQLAALNRQAHGAGAKVLLVGDPAQLDAVDAGGFLGYMERNLSASRLTSVWRFRHEWEQDASLQLRAGEPDVLELYDQHGRLHADAETDPVEAAYAAWREDITTGRNSVLIAADNTTVTELNHRAQHDQAAAGQVDLTRTVTLRADTKAGAGDLILARQNDRGLTDSDGHFITNGTRLRINTIHPDGAVTATVEGSEAQIILNRHYLTQSVELGYASTTHRAQGITVETAHSLIDSAQSREMLYVAMTRGKTANHAYLNPQDAEEDHSPDPHGVFTPEQAPETAVDALTPVVRRSSAEQTAHEIQAAEHGWAYDLGRMIHERAYLQDHQPTHPDAINDRVQALQALERAIHQQTRTHMTQIEADQPEWLQQLPPTSPDSGKDALAAAVQWRAASDQTEADTLYGRIPTRGEHLYKHYDTARTMINAAADHAPEVIGFPELAEAPNLAPSPAVGSTENLVREHHALLAFPANISDPNHNAFELERQRQIELQQQITTTLNAQQNPGGPSRG